MGLSRTGMGCLVLAFSLGHQCRRRLTRAISKDLCCLLCVFFDAYRVTRECTLYTVAVRFETRRRSTGFVSYCGVELEC